MIFLGQLSESRYMTSLAQIVSKMSGFSALLSIMMASDPLYTFLFEALLFSLKADTCHIGDMGCDDSCLQLGKLQT